MTEIPSEASPQMLINEPLKVAARRGQGSLGRDPGNIIKGQRYTTGIEIRGSTICEKSVLLLIVVRILLVISGILKLVVVVFSVQPAT